MDIPKLTEEDKKRILLNTSVKSQFIAHLEDRIKKQVIGQSEAIDSILSSIERVASGIKNKEKPVLTMLFLGPTGTGKTECVKVLAEELFGKRDAFLRINCEELASEYTVARLLGSPPGYVGNEVEPMLSQKNIDKHCKSAKDEKRGIFAESCHWGDKLYNAETGEKLSIVLFDEIEKAHPKIWTALLGIMDDGHLVLGKNEEVSFRNSIIIMTTNVGSKEIDNTLKGNTVGFDFQTPDNKHHDMKKKAVEEVKETFPPEFCNRFDEIVAFRMLDLSDIEKIIGVQLKYFFKDLLNANMPLYIRYTDSFVKYIAKEGFNQHYGARHLNRVLKHKLISPVSKFVTTGQIIMGDVLTVDYDATDILFIREPRTEEQLKKISMKEPFDCNAKPDIKKRLIRKRVVKK